jgi:DNA modification methylase
MGESFLNGRVVLHPGDCLDVLARLEECSVDSCVTDPPYHLTSIVQRFGSATAKPVRVPDINAVNCIKAAHARAAAGFMGKQWDGGAIAFDPDTWRAVFRVLKPGAHLVAMGGTRTFHRMACAIEDAGFEIRDTISWLYGSGFPKSHDVSKGIDRAAGVAREVVGNTAETSGRTIGLGTSDGYHGDIISGHCRDITAPATDAARQWAGWGTALKPACELIVLARKPLSEGTVAANVLRWRTGAINVDGCRVEAANGDEPMGWESPRGGIWKTDSNADAALIPNGKGRWPANVAHDGSDEVTAVFPDARSAGDYPSDSTTRNAAVYGKLDGQQGPLYGDTGSAARFFYTAKADADDRLGSKHPTVKPLDLMQWLVRMVTPKGGTVLDPFAGTGTTGEAAIREGMRAVLIEAEPDYQADIRRRMALVMAGPDERARESIKAKNLPRDDGPLFAARDAAWAEMWAKPFDFSQEPKP